MKEVYDFLKKNINFKTSSYIVTAISGGPDSMALLDILLKLRNDYKFNIVCAHVNHNVRKESEDEKIFLEKYCQKNDIIFEYMKINNYDKENFHNQARKIRYDFFDEITNKYNSKYLLTAHHGDDLIETVLMRITRGSNLKGYAGISLISKRKNYNILRPLLYLTKQEIKDYDDKNNIPYVIDKSNYKDCYTRNRYRKYILPFLKDESSKVHRKYLQFSEELLKYYDYIEEKVDKYYKKLFVNNELDLLKFNKLEILIKEKLIEKILIEIYKNNIDNISSIHINQIINLSTYKKPNIKINLPNGISVVKNYDRLIFRKNSDDEPKKYKYLLENGLRIGNNIFEVVKKCEDTSNYCIRLNSEEITLPLFIRNRNIGDKIEVKGLDGTKKIKDIFINSKVEIEKRDSYPLLVDSASKILWIPGLKKSKYDKSKKEKYDIIVKCNLIKEEKNEEK